MLNLRFKRVMRYDPVWPKLRLGRLMWETGKVGDGEGYSAKLALALRPCLFEFERGWDGWRVAFLGFEAHLRRSYGGIFA